MTDLQVSEEFLEENKSNRSQFMPKPRRSGPYSKHEKESRRKNVYQLHFDYGYSARKISEKLNVNRNTINGDISYWYSKIHDSESILDPEKIIQITFERLDIQRTRLCELLDNCETLRDRISVEKSLSDIDYKISNTCLKIRDSTNRSYNVGVDYLNQHLKLIKDKDRYLTMGDKIQVSSKAKKKIDMIINTDRKNLWGKNN